MKDKRRSGELEKLEKQIPEGEQGFIQLNLRGPKMKMATEQENRYNRAVCKRFIDAMREITGMNQEQPPYSAVACIMSMPELIEEDKYAQFEKWLNLLLSDQGFYFPAVRPLADGQMPLGGRTASMAANDEMYLYNVGDDTFIISQILDAFEEKCAAASAKGETLGFKPMNDAQTETIQMLVRRAVDKNLDVEELPQFWLNICNEDINLSSAGEEQLEKYEKLFSFLQRVCTEVVEAREKSKQLYRSDQIFCEKACQRLKSMKSCGGAALVDTELKEFWQSESLLLCSDLGLADKLIQRIRDQTSAKYYKETDQYNEAKEQSFSLKKYVCNNMFDISEAGISRVADELEELYVQQLGFKKAELNNLAESMKMIACFSTNRDFSVANDKEDDLPTIAPVITYLLFQNYEHKIRKGRLDRISYSRLFWPTPKGTHAVAALNFDRLCNIYAKFYKEVYNQNTRREWNIAYSVLTGRKNQCETWDEADDSDSVKIRKSLLHPCYGRVPLFIQLNQPSFLHSSVPRLCYTNKMLTSTNAVNACEWIRSKIKKNEEHHEWLSTYCNRLNAFCSIDSMRTFVDSVTRMIFDSSVRLKADLYADISAHEQSAKKNRVYQDVLTEFCKEYSLSEEFKSIHPHTICLILTEYVLYQELAEQCTRKLNKWIDQLIRWHLKDIECEGYFS